MLTAQPSTRLLQAFIFAIAFAVVLFVWLRFGRAFGISSAIWPANVVSLGALVLLRRQDFLPEVIGVALAGILVHLLLGDATAYALACGISKSITFALVGGGLSWCGITRDAPIGPDVIGRLTLVALLGPVPGALLGGWLTLAPDHGLVATGLRWWMPEVVAIALFLPPFLFWRTDAPLWPARSDADRTRPFRPRLEEMIAAALALATIGSLAVAMRHYVILELSAVALLWFAFRFGMFATAAAVSGFAIGMLALGVAGHFPFEPRGNEVASLLELQGSLAVTTLPALLIAAIRARSERERRDLLANERRLAYALDGANDGLWDWHMPSGNLFFSPRSFRILGHWSGGFTPTVGMVRHWVHPQDIAPLMRGFRDHVEGREDYFNGEFRCRRRDGSWVWLANRGRIVERDLLGEPVRMVGTLSDISERKRLEDDLHHLATHDALTGLPNRALFAQKFEAGLKRLTRQRAHLAVLLVDLDNFKTINDTLGHAAGDALLRHLARLMQGELRDGDVAARIGGDEFAVLCSGQSEAEFQALAERLCRGLAGVVDERGSALPYSVSIGIAMTNDDRTSQDELTAAADTALYDAKHAGRDTWRFFVPDAPSRIRA
ncbi:diguanylate cyclase [Ancylobacter sp. A5.8]|uniref:diguanylate cyclase domain-containing protein n=1 Tax=Ancylobacter gelatini TaxID=2919920 RepID=UPI001F4E7207|nr:diguanylate cyclase [Ancylobacter gelatini]MCJ8143974.1 diguanylate cyclase [Ancylobacter gelatini]